MLALKFFTVPVLRLLWYNYLQTDIVECCIVVKII